MSPEFEMLDAHNHLGDPRLAPFREELLRELGRLGLKRAVVNTAKEEEWEAVSALAREHSWIIPAYGIHPWFAKEAAQGWQERLRKRLDSHPQVAMGEIGLDRWIRDYDIDLQKEIFRWQLAIAAERNLPVAIHCLKAWGLLGEILANSPLPGRGFLLHSYSGPAELVEPLAKLGAYFSFSPYFLHERKAGQREVFEGIPRDRLLVETDAPDMVPPPERDPYRLTAGGERLNHPGNIALAYTGLAQIRQMEVGDLADKVAENFQRLFGAQSPT
jgi:TatD DNase family protein